MIKILYLVMIGSLLLSSCGRKSSVPAQTGKPAETESYVAATASPVSENTASGKPENAIGEEKAKEIALQKAGLSFGEVIFDRVELEKDDGIWHYEIEFKKGRTEYDADINATDGVIIGWEIDIDD